MELEELKKSWTRLDEQLKKEQITNAAMLEKLIATHKQSADTSLGRLRWMQRLSLYIGALILALLFVFAVQIYHGSLSLQAIALYLALTVIGGFWWDYKSYRLMRSIRLAELPVLEVSRKMLTLRRWVRNEIIAISIWIIGWFALYYWAAGWYAYAWEIQAVMILVSLLLDGVVIYLFYRKFIYKHLDNVRRNIEELKELCTE
ncbi:MAG: hypothetical protein LBM06_04650 [Prevotellaceae bacterium]|jgi:hypothetical protein|nr:hypothetical protein [Prevotellaceae bacterium]